MEISNNRQTYSQTTYEKSEKNTTENSFNSYFEYEKQENSTKSSEEQTKVEDVDETKALYEDIMSLLKTGFTVSELEAIQEKLIELKDKIKEGNYSQSEVEQMLSKLEKEITLLQKRVTGEAIIKVDENNTLKNEDNTLDAQDKNFLQRIEQAIIKIDNLKAPKDIKEQSASESEVLAMIDKFKS